MAYYFSIYDTVAQLKTSVERLPGQQFIFLSAHDDNTDFDTFDDMFHVDLKECNTFDVMDDDAIDVLVSLLKGTKLYRMTLELMLDEALCVADGVEDLSDSLNKALNEAFSDIGRPEKSIAATDQERQGADILHAVLLHYTHEDLAKIYMRFLQALESLPFYPAFSILEMIKLDRPPFLDRFQIVKKEDLLWMNLEKTLRGSSPVSKKMYSFEDEKTLQNIAQDRNKAQDFSKPLSHLVMQFLQLERQQLFRAEGLLWLHEHFGHIGLNWLDHEFAKLIILEHQKMAFVQAISKFENEDIEGFDQAIEDILDPYPVGQKSSFAKAVFSGKPEHLWPVLKNFIGQMRKRQVLAEKLNF